MARTLVDVRVECLQRAWSSTLLQERYAAKAAKLFMPALVVSDSVPSHALLDAGRVVQVLSNLLGNAIKFAPEHGGEVRMHADMGEPGLLRVRVADNGRGLSAAGLERLFKPFSQAEAGVRTNTHAFGSSPRDLRIVPASPCPQPRLSSAAHPPAAR